MRALAISLLVAAVLTAILSGVSRQHPDAERNTLLASIAFGVLAIASAVLSLGR